MNKISNKIENNFQSFQEGIDYSVEKSEKATNYTIWNNKAAENVIEQWQKEGFFQELPKTTPVLESNKKDNFQKRDNHDDEKIFYGWREEIPLGETRGEIKQVFYHWKIEEKEVGNEGNKKAEIKVSPDSTKKDQPAEKENNQQSLSQNTDNKDSNNKNIYYEVGVISLIILGMGMLIVWVRKKK